MRWTGACNANTRSTQAHSVKHTEHRHTAHSTQAHRHTGTQHTAHSTQAHRHTGTQHTGTPNTEHSTQHIAYSTQHTAHSTQHTATNLIVAFALERGDDGRVALGDGRLFGRALLRVLRGLEVALLLLQRVGLAQLVVLRVEE